ncbi:MAG: zinc-ribbon domain-containing protein [Oscillospiraceae bacterium]|nr:zinc-ribbon domain-containing protein [Oscillospiraceae bacterium]
MFCSNCGTMFDEGARFCAECGTPREEAPSAPPPMYPPETPEPPPFVYPEPQPPAYPEPFPSVYPEPAAVQRPAMKKGFDAKLVIIPLAVAAVMAVAFAALWYFGVISFGGESGTYVSGDDHPSPFPSVPASQPPPAPSEFSPEPSPPPVGPHTASWRGAGEIRIDGTTLVDFIPDQTGVWLIYTTDNDAGDPFLELHDGSGVIASDDDGGEGVNARISIRLEAGEAITIHAKFYSGDAGSYLLVAELAPTAALLSRDGGDVLVSDTTDFEFSPGHSGTWDIFTYDNGGSDPMLEIFDSYGRMIAQDDDGGDGMNAYLSVYLDETETYLIRAKFYGSGTGSYRLSVLANTNHHNGDQWSIPSGGGDIWIEHEAYYEFVPDRSGYWNFLTYGQTGDPLLTLYDQDWNVIASDDDSGDGINAHITVYLEADRLYFLHAAFYAGGQGSYVLSVWELG